MTTTDSTRTENDAVAEVARMAAIPTGLVPGTIYAAPNADGEVRVFDTDGFADRPRRKIGTRRLADVESLLAYVDRHGHPDDVEVYADRGERTVTAVLDANTPTDAGWNRHEAILDVEVDRDWAAWTHADRAPFTQREFAEFVEDHLTDIVEPAAADMLELAQTFQAKTRATFKSGTRLATGEVALEYVEETTATAGAKGTVSIPERITLALAPFDGGPRYKVGARFRYRVQGGDLALTVVLDRPQDVERAAWDDIVAKVREGVGEHPVYLGRLT